MSSGHDTGDDLRAALAKVADVAGDGTACPASDHLVSSARGELASAVDEEVVLHIAACTACAAAWRIAREVKGADARDAAHRDLASPHWTRWAAAAVFLVAIGGGIFYFAPERDIAPVYREQGEETIDSLVSETEPLAREEFLLRWIAVDKGALYDVVVTDERMRTLARAIGLTESRYRVPADELDGVESGARLYWQVVAYLPDGSRIESPTFIARLQ
jgi:hypothetical protein